MYDAMFKQKLRSRTKQFVKRKVGNSGWARLITLVVSHRLLRLKNPRTFNDLVQQRMLYDMSPELSWTCDKLAMKEHVSAMGIKARIPDTLWFGEELSDLASANLAGRRWVAKPNNSSGSVFFGEGVPDTVTIRDMKGSIGVGITPFDSQGEWAYSQAQKGFIVEPLLGVPPLPDFKVFVFHGFATFVRVYTGRGVDLHLTTYDREWNTLTRQKGEPVQRGVERPRFLDNILADAECIASSFAFMRVDFYVVDGEHWFGETTPYPAAGRHPTNRDFDYWLGALWASGSKQAVVNLYPEIAQFREGQQRVSLKSNTK